MCILVGTRSRRAKSSHAVLSNWRSLANEILADCATRRLLTLPRQMSEEDAIEPAGRHSIQNTRRQELIQKRLQERFTDGSALRSCSGSVPWSFRVDPQNGLLRFHSAGRTGVNDLVKRCETDNGGRRLDLHGSVTAQADNGQIEVARLSTFILRRNHCGLRGLDQMPSVIRSDYVTCWARRGFVKATSDSL